MKSVQRKRENTNAAALQAVPFPVRPKSSPRSFEERLRQCSSKLQRRISLLHTFLWLNRARAITPKHFRRRPLVSAWAWLKRNYVSSATKRLRVAETVSLGDKRFVAILRVDGREFLIGGGTSGISLLTPIKKPPIKKPSRSSRPKAAAPVMREVSR